MTSSTSFEEKRPPSDLAEIVRCVWRLMDTPRAGSTPTFQPIVPDGCLEIVLNLEDPMLRLTGVDAWEPEPTALFVGPLTQPTFVAPSGPTYVVGIRFLPWAGAAFLGFPMHEARNAFLPLDAVLQGGMAGLRERLAARASQDWASTVFDHLRLMRPASHARTALAARAVRAIGRGQVVIGELARELAIGERQLERVMARDVGLTPREVVRIARVQSALRRVRQDPGRALGHIALESGFYDQPHFTREFRRLVGCSPSHFQADELSLTHHFVSNDVGP